VSIDDIRDLGERLDGAFSAVDAGPAPVDGTRRKGSALRLRRRIAAAASIAAVVAAGVFVPLAVQRQASSGPLTRPSHSTNPSQYSVTVQSPGPHSPAGLIASGTINGKGWQFTAGNPGASGTGGGRQITASGPAIGPDQIGTCPVLPAADPAYPATFNSQASPVAQVQYGAVRADVAYVMITLGNGRVLTLHPVTVSGARLVAFAAPTGAVIAKATAYSRTGVIASAIPFTDRNGMAVFGAWLKPGQQGLARASGLIGSGTTDGTKWSEMLYLGPWGVCGIDPNGSICWAPVTTLPRRTSSFGWGGGPAIAVGSASESVLRIVVTLHDGSVIQVRPVRVGGAKFWAFGIPNGLSQDVNQAPWTAYDRAGHVVATGRM
jgi:hypothetical protein